MIGFFVFLLMILGAYSAVLVYVDDHERSRYKPHSFALYTLNVLVNLPGSFVVAMYATVAMVLGFDLPMPFDPYVNIGLVEIPHVFDGVNAPAINGEVSVLRPLPGDAAAAENLTPEGAKFLRTMLANKTD